MSDRDEILARFHRAYGEDLAGRRIRPLAEYLELFPGDEEVVRAEYAVLEGDDAPELEAESGRALGPYRVLEELGRGGQAVVYRAKHLELGREVALKVLRTVGPAGSSELRRFRREAEVAARLDHPGICSVYEAGQDDGTAYIAMRLVRGETLARRIAAVREQTPSAWSDPLDGSAATSGSRTTSVRAPWVASVALVETAARALHAAHEHGLIHRDIKPGNIMVDETGEPVLLDFGLARDDEVGGMALTLSGDVLGTPYYMAPEQVSTQLGTPDARTDVYALGVTLFECLTLQRPFDAPSREALFREILGGRPPKVTSLNAQVPHDLAVVLETAMCSDQDHRYQTALDFAEDLRRIRGREPIRAKPMPWPLRARRWVQRNRTVTVAVCAVFVALAVGVWLSLSFALREAEQRQAADREVYRGTMIAAFREADADRPGAVARLLEEARPDLRDWEWRYLNDQLDTSVETLLGAPATVVFTACGPGEDQVMAVDQDSVVHVWDRRSGKRAERRLAPQPGQRRQAPLACSARGDLVLTGVHRRVGREQPVQPVLWNTATGSVVRRFPEARARRDRCEISPAGEHVIVGGRPGDAALYEVSSGRLLGEFNSVAQAFSEDGRLVANVNGGRVIVRDPSRGGRRTGDHIVPFWDEATGLDRGRTALRGIALRADREVLAVATRTGGSIAICDLTSRQRIRMVSDGPDSPVVQLGFQGRGTLVSFSEAIRLWEPGPWHCIRSFWGVGRASPSGSVSDEWVVSGHTGERGNGVRIWQADGESLRVLRAHESAVERVAISPDGSWIASGSADDTVRVWEAASSAPVATLITRGPVLDLGFTGDRSLFVESAGGAEIWDVEQSRRTRVDRDPREEIAVITDDRRSVAYSTPGGRTVVLESPGPVICLATSPDCKRLVTGHGKGVVRIWDPLRTTESLRAMVAHEKVVFAVTYVTDSRIAAASRDGTIWIHDARTGAAVGTLRGHTATVRTLVASQDGRLVSGSDDGTVRIWETTPLADRFAARRRTAVQHRVTRLSSETPERVRQLAQPASTNRVLVLDGQSGVRCGRLRWRALDGLDSFTLECWVRGDAPDGPAALAGNWAQSGFGLYWRGGRGSPCGTVNGAGENRSAKARSVPHGRWTHLAMCYDGRSIELYVDGERVGSEEGLGRFSPSWFPFLVGAEPRVGGERRFFEGALDEVRLSRVVRYRGSFTPAKVHEPDADTLLLLHFDAEHDGLHLDASGNGQHGWPFGRPRLVADRPVR